MYSQYLENKIRGVYEKKGVPLLGILLVSLFIIETKYSLRKRKFPRIKRAIINTQLAGTAAIGFRYFLIPLLVFAAIKSSKRKSGVLTSLAIPSVVKSIFGVLILDYGNYLWHRISHHSPTIWRFHQVHHTDLDLDVSTAFRFHLGEVLPSALFRSGIVYFAGMSWKDVLVYEIAFEAANNFHHSNTKLPEDFERHLSKLIVTPRMHGIHHSIVRNETDSNFSVIFSFWDRIHKTLNLKVPQDEINVGVPGYRNIEELKFTDLFFMPFRKTRSWELPDGTIPERKKDY